MTKYFHFHSISMFFNTHFIVFHFLDASFLLLFGVFDRRKTKLFCRALCQSVVLLCCDRILIFFPFKDYMLLTKKINVSNLIGFLAEGHSRVMSRYQGTVFTVVHNFLILSPRPANIKNPFIKNQFP